MKDPNPPSSGKEIAEGKGVHCEVESEGSRMWELTNHRQTSDLTNRNRIEGYEQIAVLFLKAADNEKEHAKLWFKVLGEMGYALANPLHAAEGANAEWSDIYERIAKDAEEEDFTVLAPSSTASQQLKNCMRKNIAPCSRTWKP